MKWKLLSCVWLFATQWTILWPWDSPGQSTGVGGHSFLQVIFPTQGLKPGLPQYKWILYQLSHLWKYADKNGLNIILSFIVMVINQLEVSYNNKKLLLNKKVGWLNSK